MAKGIEIAEVVAVNYQDEDIESLYHLKCRLLGDKKARTPEYAPITARPINTSLKQPPLAGEVVLIIKGPSNISAKNTKIDEYYYLQPLNVQSSIHHNAILKIGDVEAEGSGGSKAGGYQDSSAGNANSSQDGDSELGNFPENDEIRPLQPYEGDVLLEGRFGQSIRMGSTVEEGLDQYATEPHWTSGDGGHGDPITVIRNGQKIEFSQKPDANKFINENINHDASSIYLSSEQTIPLAKASNDTIGAEQLEMEVEEYTGQQIILASNRVIINSRELETMIFSGGGIGLSSPSGISLDSADTIVLAAGEVHIGEDASSNGEPLVMGDTLNDKLDEIMDLIADICDSITKITVPTGVGPSGTPINFAEFITYGTTNVPQIKQGFPDFKSELGFINPDPDYTSENDPDTPEKNR
jgi:hypothetical protein